MFTKFITRLLNHPQVKLLLKNREMCRCRVLLSDIGNDDYLVQVQARDMEDSERIHKQHLSRMPSVARLHSSFAMRSVVKRSVSPKAISG